MIAGILYRNPEKKVTHQDLYHLFDLTTYDKSALRIVTNKNLAIGFSPAGVKTLDDRADLWHNNNDTVTVLFSGNIFNRQELLNGRDDAFSTGRVLFDLFQEKKNRLFNEINGNYILAIWNSKTQEFSLARDHLGIEPLYYFWDNEKLVFASSIKAILRHPEVKAKINIKALHTYLLFNYNPGQETLISGIKKIGPGHFLKFKNDKLSVERYWYLSFKPEQQKTEEQYAAELLPLMRETVKVRLEDDTSHGAFLSGGMDSSSIVGLMSPLIKGKLHTYSFRCKGKSFDESHYAKIVSDRYHTEHHLVEYDADEVLAIEEVVKYMDEPFCDIGIEVASFILGRAARGNTNYVLSGDGGDELFAGHPVYQADQVAQKFSTIPKPLQKIITTIFSLFPDTDKKKSFAVKAQRFAYSYQFPEQLFSNRWRIYYTISEITRLFRDEFKQKLYKSNPLDEILNIYQEADGEDFLSKTLYGDYHTVVSFYLRRMQLLRAFGIEGRFPMFDPRLVEYAAKIPSHLKLKGSETKYILHKTMAGVLPDEIVFRKDKLGHSVPFKNWLRDVPQVKKFVTDVLSESNIKNRGLFNYSFVKNLLDEHFKRTKNNSHRLWALLVLELWFQKNIDH